MSTDERLFLSLALYQVEYSCRTTGGGLQNTEFNNIDYKSIKDLLLGLSYIDAKGYSPDSIDIFNDNNTINYTIYKTATSFNLKNSLDEYDIVNPIFNTKRMVIQKNFEYCKVLDSAIKSQSFGRKGNELLALIALRSNSLFKGITHRTIPNHLLDDYGIIKDNSELKIPFYNSTTTNIALAICFAFYLPTIHIPNPDLSGYALTYTGSLILGGTLRDIKSNLKAIKNRIPSTNPKRLIEFVNDKYYLNTQMKINKLILEVSGDKRKVKKGGAVLFKDSGHVFIINEIDPSLYAFDYFNYMLHGDSSLRNKYKDQKGFILEQEILFSRLTKFTKIKFLGAITSVNKDCLSAIALEDGEISLCLDGCLYNNKGKLTCSINILGENGLQDIKFFYGPQTDDLELHMSMAVSSVNDILGVKIYSCKLEPFDSVSVPSTAIIDDTTLRLKLLSTGEYLVIDDTYKEKPDKELETLITKASDKYDNIFENLATILMDMIEQIEKTCINIGTSICETFENVLKSFTSGGAKISKITLIEKIVKIDPYIKGLSKMKKERLLTIHNQLTVLNKYKKEELIKKYKVKGKNLKKCQIIDMIFNLSNK